MEVRAEIGQLSCEEVMYHWSMISEELDKVRHVWDTWWTLESLQFAILEGNVQVWGIGTNGQVNLFVFSSVVQYPANKILRIFLAFGNSLEPLLPVIVATLYKYAMVRGCAFAEILGRKGWDKMMKIHGFTHKFSAFTLPIREMREN